MTDLPDQHPASHVEDLIQEGKPGLAARALLDVFTDHLPDLPLRFGLVLVRVDEQVARDAHAHLNGGGALELQLVAHEKNSERISVRWGPRRVGDLSADDRKLFADFGEHAALYRARPLEFSLRTDGSVQTVAVELVRPERQRCQRCNREVAATDPHTCTEPDDASDGANVAVHSALHSLVRDRGDRNR